MKLLVIHRPDEPAADPRRDGRGVRRPLRSAGLVSIIEPVAKAPRRAEPGLGRLRRRGREGARLPGRGPLQGRGSPQGPGPGGRDPRRCAQITDAVSSPWVVLSSGVPADVFPQAVELACREGASGFLAGRAVWAAVIGSDDVERDLGRGVHPAPAAPRRARRRGRPAMTTATAPRVVLVPTARPTFAVDVARSLAADARALLVELGAEVVGPEDLVMTPEDVEAAKPFLADGADLVVNVCASFSDATPALELYGDLDQPVLLWSFREPGPVGDRLWLNSMCGANLFGHALVVHAGGRRTWSSATPTSRARDERSPRRSPAACRSGSTCRRTAARAPTPPPSSPPSSHCGAAGWASSATPRPGSPPASTTARWWPRCSASRSSSSTSTRCSTAFAPWTTSSRSRSMRRPSPRSPRSGPSTPTRH